MNAHTLKNLVILFAMTAASVTQAEEKSDEIGPSPNLAFSNFELHLGNTRTQGSFSNDHSAMWSMNLNTFGKKDGKLQRLARLRAASTVGNVSQKYSLKNNSKEFEMSSIGIDAGPCYTLFSDVTTCAFVGLYGSGVSTYKYEKHEYTNKHQFNVVQGNIGTQIRYQFSTNWNTAFEANYKTSIAGMQSSQERLRDMSFTCGIGYRNNDYNERRATTLEIFKKREEESKKNL